MRLPLVMEFKQSCWRAPSISCFACIFDLIVKSSALEGHLEGEASVALTTIKNIKHEFDFIQATTCSSNHLIVQMTSLALCLELSRRFGHLERFST
jgi:hypothetical protein